MAETALVPVWRYTITLMSAPRDADAPPEDVTLSKVHVDAIGYEDDGLWTVFDDTHGTVLSRRTATILEVHRSAEPVSHQETDQL